MKKRILSIVLVVVMVAAIFVPVAPSKAEEGETIQTEAKSDGNADITLTIYPSHADDTYGYADILATVALVNMGDTDYDVIAYDMTVKDSNDEIICKYTQYALVSEGAEVFLLNKELKASEAGYYTFIVEVSMDSEVYHEEYTFYYTGWSGALGENISLSYDFDFYDMDFGNGSQLYNESCFTVMVKNKNGDPVQGESLTFQLLDETGKVIEEVNVALTNSSGTVLNYYQFADDLEEIGLLPFGVYTVRVFVADNEDVWASITFDASDGTVLDEAKSEPSDEPEDKNIVIDANSEDPEAEEVVLDQDTLQEIYDAMAEDEEILLEIILADATIKLDIDAVAALLEKAEELSESVSIHAKTIEESALSVEQKEAMKDENVYAYISLEAWAGNTIIANFDGGKVTITIPFELPEGTKAESIKVVYITENGTVTEMPTKYADGMLTFETTHFSSYAVIAETTGSGDSGNGNNQTNPGTGDNGNIMFWIMLAAAGAFFTVAVPRKKEQSRG